MGAAQRVGVQTGGQRCGREVTEHRSGLGEVGGRQLRRKEKMGALKGQGGRPEGLSMHAPLHVAGGVSSPLQVKPEAQGG